MTNDMFNVIGEEYSLSDAETFSNNLLEDCSISSSLFDIDVVPILSEGYISCQSFEWPNNNSIFVVDGLKDDDCSTRSSNSSLFIDTTPNQSISESLLQSYPVLSSTLSKSASSHLSPQKSIFNEQYSPHHSLCTQHHHTPFSTNATSDSLTSKTSSLHNAVGRKKASPEARMILMDWLADHRGNPYPSKRERADLALRTGMTKRQVINWMSNTRKRRVVPLISQLQTPRNKTDRAFIDELNKRQRLL